MIARSLIAKEIAAISEKNLHGYHRIITITAGFSVILWLPKDRVELSFCTSPASAIRGHFGAVLLFWYFMFGRHITFIAFQSESHGTAPEIIKAQTLNTSMRHRICHLPVENWTCTNHRVMNRGRSCLT